MSVPAKKIFEVIEKTAPRHLAEQWDNPGLQIGSYRQEINTILLTLDITRETVQEAIEKKADLIISHHPFIFGGLKRICFDDYKGELIQKLVQNNIGVYAAHTNLDSAREGLNQYVAKLLGLCDIEMLNGDEDHPGLVVLVTLIR